MTKTDALLTRLQKIAVLSNDEFSALAKDAHDDNIELMILDGEFINNKQQLLQRLSELLQFPNYFGHNWDALSECLADVWPVNRTRVIVLTCPRNLINNDLGAFVTFISIVEQSIVNYYYGKPNRFIIVEN